MFGNEVNEVKEVKEVNCTQLHSAVVRIARVNGRGGIATILYARNGVLGPGPQKQVRFDADEHRRISAAVGPGSVPPPPHLSISCTDLRLLTVSSDPKRRHEAQHRAAGRDRVGVSSPTSNAANRQTYGRIDRCKARTRGDSPRSGRAIARNEGTPVRPERT